MAPPVSFLQQLAPAAQRGGAFVRAAVPSRFAPHEKGVEEASSTALSDEASQSPTRSRVQADPTVSSVPRISSEPSPTPMLNAAREWHREPVAARAASDAVDEDASPISHERIIERTPVQTQIVISQQPRVSEPISSVATAEARVSDENRVAASPIIRTSVVASPNVTVRPPLREHVREQRMSASVEMQPTVVHVTIDRIDVRAATTNAAPDRAAPKSRNASWKSLGDYLKQGDRANGGAS